MREIWNWYDRDHTHYAAREADCGTCEHGEGDCGLPAEVEVSAWPQGSEPGYWVPFCEAHYEEMRADPFHNPEGTHADAYVGMGEALP